jgi:hypothetical protein
MGFVSRNYRRFGNYGYENSARKESLRLCCCCHGKYNVGLREAVSLNENLVCEMRKTKAGGLIIRKNSSLLGVGNCYIRF